MTNHESVRRFRGTQLNPTHAAPLARAIGGLLVNFGVLEMAADAWLHALSTDALAAEEFHRLRLGTRIQTILRFLDAGRIPPDMAHEAAELWKRARPLSEIRNQVAHNPVFFGWHGAEREGDPDFCGVLDKRHGTRRAGPTPGLIPLSEVEEAQNATAALAQELLVLARRIDAVEAWPPDNSSAGSHSTDTPS